MSNNAPNEASRIDDVQAVIRRVDSMVALFVAPRLLERRNAQNPSEDHE